MTVRQAARMAMVMALMAATTACQSLPTNGNAGAPANDPDSIRWVRDAAEYHAAFLQAFAAATARVEAEAASRADGTWAVVVDADETVISNLAYQVERSRAGLEYTPESWADWVRRREATPLPGAAEFLARVRALGGRVAVVTNRLASECADTEAVFEAHAIVFDAMLCRPDGEPSAKEPRFDAVAEGRSDAGGPTLDIVAFVGDNIQDFPGLRQAARDDSPEAFSLFGQRYFLVPNPMYGSWR